jgi:hypothetical protein
MTSNMWMQEGGDACKEGGTCLCNSVEKKSLGLFGKELVNC